MSICLTVSDEVSDDSWKTSIPKYNGLGTEGIGSVFQYQLLLAFYADFIGVDYTFSGSINLAHHSYTAYTMEEYCSFLDKFFNLSNIKTEWDEVFMFAELQSTSDPRGAEIFNGELVSFIEKNKDTEKNILINLHWCHVHLLKFCQQNATEIFTKERIEFIRNNLVFDGHKYFEDGVNICWHLRTANPNDIPAEIVSPLRDYYTPEKNFSRYENLIELLKSNSEGRKVTLHIHSQGFTHDFQPLLDLKEENFNIVSHIDESPLSDLYHMAHADLLVMSNSSFSWIASLLNTNQTIVRDNWSQFVHSNSLRVNYHYKLL